MYVKTIQKISILFVCLFLCSCAGTVVQQSVYSTQASYDGTQQNSGIYGVSLDRKYFVITPHYRDRYNDLIKDWSTLFRPPLNKDDGITDVTSGVDYFDDKNQKQHIVGAYLIDPDHKVKFSKMNEWDKKAKPAPGIISKILK